MFKTYICKPKNINRKWFLIDGENLVLGRLASIIAKIIRGKNKPEFTPNIDMGDKVVVINAEKIKLTGNKMDKKIYYRHTGYPGGLKSVKAKDIIESKFPERLLEKAVTNMLSKGPLARKQIKNLYIYKGAEHPHHGQNPEKLDIANLNRKNLIK